MFIGIRPATDFCSIRVDYKTENRFIAAYRSVDLDLSDSYCRQYCKHIKETVMIHLLSIVPKITSKGAMTRPYICKCYTP